MYYNDIVPEINALCEKYPKCFVASPADCPYNDLCFVDYEGANNGNMAFETAILTRYMEVKTGKTHHKFYFTFGSDPQFPYQNTYLIVLADTMENAIEKFREKYPDRSENVCNCAFWYTEEEWIKSGQKTVYGEPIETFA